MKSRVLAAERWYGVSVTAMGLQQWDFYGLLDCPVWPWACVKVLVLVRFHHNTGSCAIRPAAMFHRTIMHFVCSSEININFPSILNSSGRYCRSSLGRPSRSLVGSILGSVWLVYTKAGWFLALKGLTKIHPITSRVLKLIGMEF